MLSSLVSQVVSPVVHSPKAKVVKAKSPKSQVPSVKVEVVTVKSPKIVEVKVEKPLGIGQVIVKELKAGSKPKEVLELIQQQFEGCKTTMACVYWYKSKINGGYL